MFTALLIFCLFYTLLCVFAIVYLLTMISRRATTENDLQHRGVRITGWLSTQISPNLSATSLPFTYEYAGKTYKQRQWVSKQYADVFHAETAVDILSLPERPEIAMLANMSPDHWESRILKRRARTAFMLFGIVFLLSILLLAINR
ncbi:MAG TPA: hypothetical protein VFN35_04600 [Ktedonobacteraceae bacterium]|nr:hypothetical protein [Ktedonobacteraceae bacterium]